MFLYGSSTVLCNLNLVFILSFFNLISGSNLKQIYYQKRIFKQFEDSFWVFLSHTLIPTTLILIFRFRIFIKTDILMFVLSSRTCYFISVSAVMYELFSSSILDLNKLKTSSYNILYFAVFWIYYLLSWALDLSFCSVQ